jgi:diphthamide synthase subunit DPH2
MPQVQEREQTKTTRARCKIRPTQIMKTTAQAQKFDTIIESRINGNIGWVKEEVKKLSKANRKELYQHYLENFSPCEYKDFFFNLI